MMRLLKRVIFLVFVVWCIAIGVQNTPSLKQTNSNEPATVQTVNNSNQQNKQMHEQKVRNVPTAFKQLLLQLGEILLSLLQLAVRFLQLIIQMLRQGLSIIGN